MNNQIPDIFAMCDNVKKQVVTSRALSVNERNLKSWSKKDARPCIISWDMMGYHIDFFEKSVFFDCKVIVKDVSTNIMFSHLKYSNWVLTPRSPCRICF